MVRNTYQSAPGAPRIRGSLGDGGSPSSAMTPEVMLDMIFDFLRRRGWIAILLGLIVGGVAVYFALNLLPPTYTAVAKISITTPENLRPEAYKENMASRITVDEVLNKALDSKEAKALPFVQNSPNPVEVLRKWIKIDSKPISDIVEISLESGDPNEITVLVNAIVDSYLATSITWKNQNQMQEEAEHKKKREMLAEQIRTLSKRVQDMAKRANNNTTEQVKQELITKQEEYRVNKLEQDNAEVNANKAELAWKTKRDAKPELTPAEILSLSMHSDPEIANLKKIINKAIAQAEEQKGIDVNGAQSAEYQRLKALIKDKQDELDEIEDRRKRPLMERRKREIAEEAESLRATYELLRDRKLKADSSINMLTSKINFLKELLAEINPVEAELGKAKEQMDQVDKKLQAIQDDSSARYISKIQPASTPSIPTRSKARLAMIGFAGLGGLAFVVLIFWFLDFRLKLVTNPESLQRQLSISVLGILPWIPKNRRLPTDNDFDDKSRSKKQWQAMQDGINSLRITLTFAPDRANDGLSSLMISSARDGEGKSTLSGSLAVSLARSGVKVILVDSDLYRPVQHTTFDMPQAPGLAEVLNGTATLDQAVRETPYPNLYLLPAGSRVDHVDSLLTNERLKSVFDELKSKFATVIIDAPPVLPVYDTLLFGQQADQTILCAMCNHSQVFLLKQAQQKLESVGIPVMGVVVAGASAGSKYSYYYYSQGYQRSPSSGHPPAAATRPVPEQASPNGNGSTPNITAKPSPNGNGSHSQTQEPAHQEV